MLRFRQSASAAQTAAGYKASLCHNGTITSYGLRPLLGRLLAGLLCTSLLSTPAAAMVILSCEPEWASLARQLASDSAEISSATTALQDPHHIEARPGLIARARRADLVVCTGGGLEEGWLPLLQSESANPRIQRGADGYLTLIEYAAVLERPTNLSRADGDIHPDGNPHIHLDPRNIERIAPVISDRLIRIDPANATRYRQRLLDFKTRWQSAMQRWQQQALPLKGRTLVVQHKAWSYLASWLGLTIIGDLEPKPGLEPSASHLSKLLNDLAGKRVDWIVRAPFQNPRASRWLADKLNQNVVLLPYTVGGNSEAGDLFQLFDNILNQLSQGRSP